MDPSTRKESWRRPVSGTRVAEETWRICKGHMLAVVVYTVIWEARPEAGTTFWTSRKAEPDIQQWLSGAGIQGPPQAARAPHKLTMIARENEK